MPSYPYLTDILNAMLGTDWALPIPTFGLMVAAALLIGTHVARRDTQRLEATGLLPASTHRIVGDMVFFSALAGFAGARIFHILDSPAQFMADPAAMILSRSGFSIYGGLLLGMTAGILFLRRRRLPVTPMLDAIAPALMLGYAIGRLGCQLSGDGDWGVAANMSLKPGWVPDWFWAQTYDGNIVGEDIAAPGVYPTPLYEAVAALTLFGLLRAIRPVAQQPGLLFSIYLLMAGFERLLVEKIRVNVRHEWFGISLTQAEFVSVLLVTAGAAGVVIALKGRRLWPRVLLVTGVAAALSACAHFPGA